MYRGIMMSSRIPWIFLTLIIITMKPSFVQSENRIELPAPQLDSDYSVEKAMLERRSVREYSGVALSLEEFAQLLWACQGISSPSGYRTAPSAGALYPLEVYAVVKDVDGLTSGVYHYTPGPGIDTHHLERLLDGDKTRELAGAALGQGCILNAAVNIVIGAVVERTAVKYGQRAVQYVHIEAGHAAQNVCLQAQGLGIGVVTVGAFYEDRVKKVIGVNANPIYIICVGKKR